MGKIIRTDGTCESIRPTNEHTFSLDELQSIVGGGIDIISMGRNKVIVVNADSEYLQLEDNELASEEVGFTVKGDVLISHNKFIM